MMPTSITAAEPTEFLSRKQAATFLNISQAWIRKQERAGRGPERVHFGKCVRYERQSLIAFAQAHKGEK